MSICLCNLTADQVLEQIAQKRIELSPAAPDPTVFVADLNFAKEELGELMDRLPVPLELLVGDAKARRRSSAMACHVWQGPLPANGFLSLGEGVYISSPEFTLLQQANQLHQANLCKMLGRYLGTWTPDANKPGGQDTRAPLTSFDALRSMLQSVGEVRGAKNLKLAMAHTCEGAASAPETALQLALCLPPELYGLNITQPIMNYEVQLSTEGCRLYAHETVRIDLCWPDKKFGLEYQGADHGNCLGEDYARWFAARERGYELWFVAKERLESAAQMLHIGREVAKRIDFPVNEIVWPTEGDLQNLLDTLMGWQHPKPVSATEMRRRHVLISKRRRKIRAHVNPQYKGGLLPLSSAATALGLSPSSAWL